MYLREFSLGNFKAFGPTQTLPIKPGLRGHNTQLDTDSVNVTG